MPPTPIEIPADSNVERSWQVFGGDGQELHLTLLKERCEQERLGTTGEVLSHQFRLHLHRGISYLATLHTIRFLVDLDIRLVFHLIYKSACAPRPLLPAGALVVPPG